MEETSDNNIVSQTEEEAANLGGWTFITKNVLHERVAYAQLQHIAKTKRKTRNCACSIVNGRKCYTSFCVNRSARILCHPSCSKLCRNSPLTNNQFPGLFIKFDGHNQIHVHAAEDILIHNFVGEFRGDVFLSAENLTEDQIYCSYSLTSLQHVICSKDQGTIITRCQHHCINSNLSVVEFATENTYILLVRSTRNILAGEELLLNYGIEYASLEEAKGNECHCGEFCRGYKGRVVSHAKKAPDPQPFGVLSNELPIHIQRILNDPEPLCPPEGYQETHEFKSFEDTFFVYLVDNELVIGGGQVIGCFKNRVDVVVYRVSSRHRDWHDVFVPMFLCFHYHFLASFRLKRYNDAEIASIKDFYSKPNNKEAADSLQTTLVPEYFLKFQHQILEEVTVPLHQSGYGVIGLPLFSVPVTKKSKKMHEKRQGNTRREVELKQHGESGNSDEEHNELTTYSLLPNKTLYSSTIKKDFQKTIDKCSPFATAMRITQSAVENIAFYAYNRMKVHDSKTIEYEDLCDTIRRIVEYKYLRAPASQRQFFHLSHWKIICEYICPGSSLLFYCSLCSKEKTEGYRKAAAIHFDKFHRFCMKEYKCPDEECEDVFLLPSALRQHLKTNHLNIYCLLDHSIPLYIRDAIQDYVLSFTKHGDFHHTIIPGLTHLKVDHSVKNANGQELFKIKKTYKVLTDFDKIQFTEDEIPISQNGKKNETVNYSDDTSDSEDSESKSPAIQPASSFSDQLEACDQDKIPQSRSNRIIRKVKKNTLAFQRPVRSPTITSYFPPLSSLPATTKMQPEASLTSISLNPSSSSTTDNKHGNSTIT